MKANDTRGVDTQYHPPSAEPLATAASNQPEPTDDGYPYDAEDSDGELEFDCHMGKDGSCGLAGTEECDWECPYNR